MSCRGAGELRVARHASGSAIRAAMGDAGPDGGADGGWDTGPAPDDPVDAERREPIDLALGEPRWRPHALPGLQDIGTGDLRLGYGPQLGDSTLRAEVARFEHGSIDEVLITAGAQAALFAVVQTFVGPGDAVLVPDPGFPAYRSLTELAGGRAVPYRLGESFDLDADRLLEVLEQTPRARLVVLNHPSNPTGGLASAAALRRVAEACVARRVVLLSDEVYRELHDGRRPAGLRAVTERGLVVGSMSKAFAAPGLRVGWLVGDPALLEPCRRLHALATTHAATLSQDVALTLLRARDEALPAMRRQLARRRDAVGCWTNLATRARAGLYAWLDVGGDDAELCRRALRRGVAVVPGRAFGERGRGYVRLSLGASPAAIGEGVRRLRSAIDSTETPS